MAVWYKSDPSFLEKVTMGAAATTLVLHRLNDLGHDVIELERYSTSNKIWKTKIKRIRVPDLLCLRCGRRIEVRAKKRLAIIMSDSERERRSWDDGLRDEDLAIFVKGDTPYDMPAWGRSPSLNAYRIGDLRATAHRSTARQRKGRDEGFEEQRVWPSWVPDYRATVLEVSADRVRLVKDNGTVVSYPLSKRGFYPHVQPGQVIAAGEVIAASVVPTMANLECVGGTYDFTKDLHSSNPADAYAAVKALGFLEGMGRGALSNLRVIPAGGHPEPLVQLEACASLARLGDDAGWEGIAGFLDHIEHSCRMEAVFVLGELNCPRARDLLLAVARGESHSEQGSELRAAAVWTLGTQTFQTPIWDLIPFLGDPDPMVAIHAVAAVAPLVDASILYDLCRSLGPPRISAGIVRAVVDAGCRDADSVAAYLFREATPEQRPWLVYLLGLMGEEAARPAIAAWADQSQDVLPCLELLWQQHVPNWTNDLNTLNLISFTHKQRLYGNNRHRNRR